MGGGGLGFPGAPVTSAKEGAAKTKKEEDVGILWHMGAGFYSGLATRALCQPLDVLKVRFQLQEEPIARGPEGGKYRGLRQALRLVLAEEGWRALWKGHVPAQALSVIYGSVQFGSYSTLARRLRATKLFSEPGVNFIAGCGAGTVAVTAAQPFDVLRTRLIAQGEKGRMYPSFSQALPVLLKSEGPRGLFRGWVPAVVYVAPYTGANFALYKLGHRFLRGKAESGSLRAQSATFAAGTMSGFLSKAIVYPCDVVKKRLQMVGFEAGRVGYGRTSSYRGSREALRGILSTEGWRGLYKGLLPSLLKASAMSGLSFLFFEQAILLARLANRLSPNIPDDHEND